MYGLSESIIKEIKNITNKHKNISFLIFGSRTRGDYKSTSDIDIAILDKVSSEERYEIMNDFDLLNIIYKIDLVFVHDIKNNKFIDTIKKEGIKIW